MQHQLVTTPARPSRAQIEPAALALLSRHSAGLLATARRYSATPEDAEDAYQRGVEILLTKAPSTTEDELLPWLKTVVKHEAYAVRKAGGRALPSEDAAAAEADARAWTDERAERYERLRLGAEAMAGLKPQEIRCLLLKAEGLSYQEICSATGWSYTKVNRCLTEGRKSFLARVAGIESGAECERLAPLISKVADGEASGEEMRVVRPHLKSCLACKATLREYRAAPSRLAGLVPPVVALAGGGGGASTFFGRLVDRVIGIGDAAGAKAAAVAASAVVLAGGGAAAAIDAAHHDPPKVAPSAFAASASEPTGLASPASLVPPARSTTPASSAPDPSTAAIEAVSDPAQNASTNSSPTSAAPDPSRPGPTDPAPEFDPGTDASGSGSPVNATNEFAAAPAGSSTPLASAPAPSGSALTSAPSGSTRTKAPSGSSGAGEFGP
jgi:RNA polymerase sigma factor (sigma-70 family)